MIKYLLSRARGSVVERQTDNLKVPGSIPGAPTVLKKKNRQGWHSPRPLRGDRREASFIHTRKLPIV